MSQSGNPTPLVQPQRDLPPLRRPDWNLWRTVIEVAASIGLVSGVIQIEQRLFPSALASPDWLAPLVYLGATCLPLTRLFYLAGREVQCVLRRVSTDAGAYRRAEMLTAEISELRAAATNREHLIIAQRDQLERLADFVERTHWLAPNLHRALVVGSVHEDGRLILLAESDFALRAVVGDVFIVVGREPIEILGEFRFTNESKRGYHLRAVSIRDDLWWAAVWEAGWNGLLAAQGLVAILGPAPRLDLE